MDFTPTGSLSIATASIGWCIARCPIWHTWTGATGTTDEKFTTSLVKVHLSEPPPPQDTTYSRSELEALRPYAVVTNLPPALAPPARELYLRTRNANEQFLEWHTNYVLLVSDIPEELQGAGPAGRHYMLNRISVLMDELLEQSGTGSTENYPLPFIQKLALMDGPTHPDSTKVNEQGFFSSAILRVESGLR